MSGQPFALPLPDLQIAFTERLLEARGKFLQEAVLETIGRCELQDLDREGHAHVPAGALQQVAGRGLRTELVFALPSRWRSRPVRPWPPISSGESKHGGFWPAAPVALPGWCTAASSGRPEGVARCCRGRRSAKSAIDRLVWKRPLPALLSLD